MSTALSTLDLTGAAWRKSSRSSNAGSNGACVEFTLATATWQKSTRSGNAGNNDNCVEVALPAEITEPGSAVAIRDSKNPAGPVLAFPTPSWTHFLTH